MSEVIFESGDVVTCAFFGDKEFVLREIENSEYPILISYATSGGSRRDEFFTREGLSHLHHSSPVLKLVRKKQKEREWVQVFRVACKNESFQLIKDFDSYDDAFYWIKRSGITSWEYQIERFYKVRE